MKTDMYLMTTLSLLILFYSFAVIFYNVQVTYLNKITMPYEYTACVSSC